MFDNFLTHVYINVSLFGLRKFPGCVSTHKFIDLYLFEVHDIRHVMKNKHDAF